MGYFTNDDLPPILRERTMPAEWTIDGTTKVDIEFDGDMSVHAAIRVTMRDGRVEDRVVLNDKESRAYRLFAQHPLRQTVYTRFSSGVDHFIGISVPFWLWSLFDGLVKYAWDDCGMMLQCAIFHEWTPEQQAALDTMGRLDGSPKQIDAFVYDALGFRPAVPVRVD